MNAPRYEKSIPMIDLDGCDAIGGERAALLGNLRGAARQVGFFYLTAHGIKRYFADLAEPCASTLPSSGY